VALPAELTANQPSNPNPNIHTTTQGAASRDIVLNNGALRPLVQCVLRHQDSQQILRIGSWALNNLCDSQPRPALDIAVVMPALKALVRSEDSEVLSHTCWALSHLCDGPSAHIKAVVEADICWRLVELLQHRSWRVTKPALRTIGNIVCAEDEVDYTQYIIEAGAVPFLRGLIAHSNREIQKEACWTLSNIAAGTCDQIQTVLDSGAIPLLVQLAMQPPAVTDAEVRSEACWVVLNATSCGSDQQIEYLVKEGCIRVLGDLLGEANMVMMALEGLERILQVGDDEARRTGGANPYAAMLSATKIEELESHRSAAIAKRAQRIWKQHFVTCAICNHTFSKQVRGNGWRGMKMKGAGSGGLS
jgi:importin subunit alpha-6/7